MCRVATLQVELASTAARTARAWAAPQLEQWELPLLKENVTLLLSELVTNADIHTQSAPFLTMAVTGGYLEAGCTDGASVDSELSNYEVPQGETLGPGTAIRLHGGRGLRIVDALADAWGENRTEGGKHVWFRLAVGSWPYHHDCRCPSTSSRDAVRLDSATLVRHNKGPWDN